MASIPLRIEEERKRLVDNIDAIDVIDENSVYNNEILKGEIIATISKGKFIVKEGKFLGGQGEYLPRRLEI